MRGRRKADPTWIAACGQIRVGLCAHALFAVLGVRISTSVARGQRKAGRATLLKSHQSSSDKAPSEIPISLPSASTIRHSLSKHCTETLENCVRQVESYSGQPLFAWVISSRSSFSLDSDIDIIRHSLEHVVCGTTTQSKFVSQLRSHSSGRALYGPPQEANKIAKLMVNILVMFPSFWWIKLFTKCRPISVTL